MVQKGVKHIIVEFVDGTSTEVDMDGTSAAFYRERLTYQENEKGQPTHMLIISEIFWATKQEITP